MISAQPPDFATLARKLAAKAGAIADAQSARSALERRGDPRRWRRATLIWPLFTRR